MPSIPSNLSRVPNLLRSQLVLSSLSTTNLQLLKVQQQIATGKAVSRYSDDAIAASAISVLRQRRAEGSQTLKNLDNADNTLTYLDTSVADTLTLAQDAKTLASSQIGAQSDTVTRNNQAVVVDGMIRQLLQLANRSTNAVYVFGGSTATSPPIQELRGGYRYLGQGSGLLAQLGSAADVPITIGGENAIGETSARIRSTVDLNPDLTVDTQLSDLKGARGLGVTKGQVQFQFGSGPVATVDLSAADTVGDVQSALTGAIRQYETDNSVTILGPGGVSITGGTLTIDVASGSLSFSDIGTGITGQDLGLTQAAFTPSSSTSANLDAKVTLLTPVSALSGLTIPLGTIRFRFSTGSSTSITDVDLSGVQTVDDLRSRIESAAPGTRVRINAAGTGIDVLNELGGLTMSVEYTGTGPDTATELGIRSLALTTKISDFNDGRGVGIVDNVADPISGVTTRALNTDFRVFLGNGQAFDVDLRPQDLTDVQSVIARINSEYATAVGQPPIVSSAPSLVAGQLTAQLSTTGNGIALAQTGVTGAVRVEKLNNSPASEELGFQNGTYDTGSASLIAQDRTGVRVNNLFSALVRLRDALRANDSSGITIAGQEVDQSINRLAETQALVGVYANRVTKAQNRQEDENTIHENMQSQLQDIDITEAAIRLNTLQTQLQASLTVGGRIQGLTLLDFLS